MEIIKDERTYEGVHAIPAAIMAMMESSGIRKMIDDRCRAEDPGCYGLTAGMAVKAMVGTMVERGKTPLYRVSDYYSTTPTDLIFGRDVDPNSLSDTILADRLDTIFRLDMRDVLREAYVLLRDKYGFETKYLFMDGSNYTMFGTNYLLRQMKFDFELEEEGLAPKESPIPAYGGNAKDGHNDLVQMNIHHVVDQNGILITSQSHSGNTSDVKMNEDMIGYIARVVDLKNVVLMGDCKLCVMDILMGLIDSGAKFVTKVPLSFNDKLRDTIVYSVLHSEMDCSTTRPHRRYYETVETIGGHDLRVIAYILPKAAKESEVFLRNTGLKKLQRSMKTLSRKSFFCAQDAMDAYEQTLGSAEGHCYLADAEVYIDDSMEKRKKDGKRYRVKVSDIRVDPNRIGSAIAEHSVQVLISNIPYSEIHSEDARIQASSDDVIDLYLEQYKAEAGFKMMKSGMNIGDVYIHTPSRITAVAFVVSLATMLCIVANNVLKDTKKKGERRRTVKTLADIHENTLVWYDRRKDRMTITGRPGDTSLIFDYVDRLGIDPELLLGHL